MDKVRALLINSEKKIVEEKFINNEFHIYEFFKEAYRLMKLKEDYDVPELNICNNIYNEDIFDGDVLFNPGHHNVFGNPFHCWGCGFKAHNPQIFITPSGAKKLNFRGFVLLIGEVTYIEDKKIQILPLKFTIEEVTESLQWNYKKYALDLEMSKEEKQAWAAEKTKEIQDNGYS
ncbi:hypothetical protein SAMN05444397_1185 [Flavobacterium aquidurense]|uniref:Immunity protein 35 n=1 Tax=Flavobacterium frigidimaris TaxID=262320 RepID=A0ABX4BLP1_FLAFR|nr:hypothetical protein [Flavobacterium frigidimaris]OXA76531.1 hypothetical protein B0A65_18640 [Flavobacterium frigidimaris]SDZ66860.1 hypothetical protein SAMN05444397_1185 [Flavobacterium aquidurense]